MWLLSKLQLIIMSRAAQRKDLFRVLGQLGVAFPVGIVGSQQLNIALHGILLGQAYVTDESQHAHAGSSMDGRTFGCFPGSPLGLGLKLEEANCSSYGTVERQKHVDGLPEQPMAQLPCCHLRWLACKTSAKHNIVKGVRRQGSLPLPNLVVLQLDIVAGSSHGRSVADQPHGFLELCFRHGFA